VKNWTDGLLFILVPLGILATAVAALLVSYYFFGPVQH